MTKKIIISKCCYWLCHKKPKIRKFENGYAISCTGCGHSFVEFGKTKEEAIIKWNKRVKRK